ncbi:MAG TPA: hypothetical protein VFD62_04185 [Pyrinomonadaceae bacterium]|nr:hypothetical protein [Pyrinomonadaceae bacterium]
MDPTSQDAQDELTRRHKAAATTVLGLIVATILLSIVAYLAKPYFSELESRPIDWAFLILVLMLGLGAVAWRRTKFAPARLQDIAGLYGVSGLVKTFEKTTLQLAILAAGIAVIGFVATLMTGQEFYTYRASAIAILVLAYSYPTKSSWIRAIERYTAKPEEPETPEPPTSPELGL